MSEISIGILGLILLLAFFLTGIDLGFAMVIIGFLGFAYIKGFHPALSILGKDFFDVFSSYSFTVVPLFMLMGQIAFNAGIAKKLYGTAHKFMGHIPGGLAVATVAGATVFKAICGSSTATAATFASVAVPEMDRYDYGRKLSTGIVASVGTLGVLLPPSAVLIIFGVLTQQSIGKLFMGGVIPGFIIALLFVIIIIVWCRLDPKIGPKSRTYSWRERIISLPDVVWPILIICLVISGLLVGLFTPTEAGSVGTFLVLVLCIIKEKFNFRSLLNSLRETVRSSCMVLLLIAGSTVLGHFLAVTRIPMMAADWVVTLNLPPYLVMVMILFVYLIGGSFLDDIAFMVLATPILFPAVTRLGFDPIWFGILVAVTVMIGVVIPPVAINVFVVRNITKESFSTIYAGVYPFLFGLAACGIALFVFPQLVTFLPALFMK